MDAARGGTSAAEAPSAGAPESQGNAADGAAVATEGGGAAAAAEAAAESAEAAKAVQAKRDADAARLAAAAVQLPQMSAQELVQRTDSAMTDAAALAVMQVRQHAGMTHRPHTQAYRWSVLGVLAGMAAALLAGSCLVLCGVESTAAALCWALRQLPCMVHSAGAGASC